LPAALPRPEDGAYREPVEAAKPLLLMDVDGVLNPYPGLPEGYKEFEFFPEDEEPVRLAAVHGDWLRELASHFTMVWATAWGQHANRLLSPHFGLPELPVIVSPTGRFEGVPEKLPAIDTFVGDRAMAWVDDIITDQARVWATQRTGPTLLIEVDPAVGLTRQIVDRLIVWAQQIRGPEPREGLTQERTPPSRDIQDGREG
jgi:hypothetical protein